MAAPRQRSTASLPARLRWLSSHMKLISADMALVKTSHLWATHAGQLAGAARIAAQWAGEMEKVTK